MDRSLLASATIAAALHAAVLLGYRPASSDLPRAMVKPIIAVREFILPTETTPPEESLAETPVPDSAPGALRPIIPEPTPTELPSTHEISFERPRYHLSDLPLDRIPLGPGGPGGVGDHPGMGPEGIFNPRDLSNTPRVTVTARPIYPVEARQSGRTGEVVVEFIVDVNGYVHAPTVVRSSDRIFDDAAVRAVARWKFEPGRRDGRAVRFRMALPIVFTLNGD
jgi:protein TonB